MQERHTWQVENVDGTQVAGSLPWYTATAAYRLAERTQEAGVTCYVTRDGRRVRTYEANRG